MPTTPQDPEALARMLQLLQQPLPQAPMASHGGPAPPIRPMPSHRTKGDINLPQKSLPSSGFGGYSTTVPGAGQESGSTLNFRDPTEDILHEDILGAMRPYNGNVPSATPPGSGGLGMQDYLGLGGLGVSALGTYLNNKNQNKQFDQNLQMEQAQLAQGQANAGLTATQMNPYAQQNDLFQMAMRRALATNGPAQATFGSTVPNNPAAGDIKGAASQFLNDSALANAGLNFESARLHADPNATPNSLAGAGLGDAGAAADTKLSAQKSAVQSALAAQPEKKKGGGFWKKFAKIAAIAAPIVAAPFTGGASLALIGAGSGAASGALNGGGLKGALLGAGLGAIPMGGAGSAAKGAVKGGLTAGLKQAGKSLLTKPSNALALANALRR